MKTDTQTMYVQKSKSFLVNGNEYIDSLLLALEMNGVLSTDFKQDITGVALTILHNGKAHREFIEQSAESIKEKMSWVTIFSQSFIDFVYQNLIRGLEYEIYEKN
jgi:hypothetical protein